ncbi:N-formylglutamate amidohydrolase [Fuerstiella marisgermanici]|uniref:N-formylglutamate deformylase n=1 Tax=Fuerstiella marisgermanici TaxID=1891926 RepID=A0A1P8WHJ6_9PLAN|nr:N-formylglutamate amidohydrolase [Fuerstiella marisgermanici]APZ93541.1 N-formylglutamate deformylase [Fuerstiella marisgermanici]
MAITPYCIFQRGRSPVVAAAVHNGHDTRKRVERHLLLSDDARLREEDPITGEWSQVARTQIVGLRSRFEVDLNRPRDKSVYKKPEDAWGLEVWDAPPDEDMIAASLKEYDDFYAAVDELLTELVDEFGKVVVYDLHSYNHLRDGDGHPPADEVANPEVNIGTGTMDRDFWAPVVDRFVKDLRRYDFHGRHLDVRENVKFQGGYFGEWIHNRFPEQVCAIAIEFKKFFMNEWTGEEDPDEVDAIYGALRSTVPGVEAELKRL